MDGLKSSYITYENQIIKSKFIRPFFLALFGALLGFFEKYAGNVSWVHFDTSIEFWLVLITLISVFSHTKWTAAFHSSIFLLAMVFSYYITYYMTLGFVPMHLLQGWLLFALLSSVYGFFIWHVKKRGISTALIGAIPIAILLQRGYYFIPDLFFRQPINDIPQPFFGIDISSGFNFLASVLLFFLFLKIIKSPKSFLLSILLLFFLFRKTEIINYLYIY